MDKLPHQSFKALSPAKLIITGEHSVVHGGPAYVMAINRFACTQILTQEESPNRVLFHLVDLRHTASVTLFALKELRQRLLNAYYSCLNGKIRIRNVLRKPTDLFQFALSTLIESFQIGLTKGLNIELTSNIPIGCGMGSSAATLLSVLKAIAHFLQLDVNSDWLYRLCLEAERLQHGRSSGVDPYICLHGGFVRFQQQDTQNLKMPDLSSMFLVNTGKPRSTTGECVIQVSSKFANTSIWKEFSFISDKIAVNLQYPNSPNQFQELQHLIRYNHRLLVKIGVVPRRICQFIEAIEACGGAAKICGAGAIKGEEAGAVLVIASSPPYEICQQFGYNLMPIQGEALGTRII